MYPDSGEAECIREQTYAYSRYADGKLRSGELAERFGAERQMMCSYHRS